MGNSTYLPGDSVLLIDIGEQPHHRADPGNTLVCVTINVNTNCCRGNDNPNGGAVGDFLGPDGVPITTFNNIGVATDIIYSVRYAYQLRLAKRGFPTDLLGEYKCIVPGWEGYVTANINISSKYNLERIFSMRLIVTGM